MNFNGADFADGNWETEPEPDRPEEKFEKLPSQLLDCAAEILSLLTDGSTTLAAYHRKFISDFVAKNFTPTEVFGKEAIIREALKHLEAK